MPEECPPSVAAFVLAWLYHEPTKLELSDEPGNMDFLTQLKRGAEFLGMDELRSHVVVVINNIMGIVKDEVKIDADNDVREMSKSSTNGTLTRRRGTHSFNSKIDYKVTHKRLVVKLKRLGVVNDDAAVTLTTMRS